MRVPLATYRLQFNPEFGFREALSITGYLRELGITDVYSGPVFKSCKGSTHGYDIVDHSELNPELGGEAGFEALAKELKGRRMGLVLDIVPNHMAFDGENTLLMDVLENGTNSRYSGFFDIEWNHPYESLKHRLLAPFLSTIYGESLERGEITLRYEQGEFSITCPGLSFPLCIESYARVLTLELNELRKKLGPEDPDFVKLLGVLYALKNLLPSKESLGERYAQVRFIKRLLNDLYADNPIIRSFVNSNVSLFNGSPAGQDDRWGRMESLLAEQLFRLSFWKVATEEINYRRFFSINGLISLRAEDQMVFDQTHALVEKLLKRGSVTGLRIDHIDGLYDPSAYLARLRALSPDAYVVVEKVLAFGEVLPGPWPVQGTTGYDFLNHVNGIFCDRSSAASFSRTYAAFSAQKDPYEETLHRKKKLILNKHMTGDVDNLAHMLKSISSRDRYGSDITLYGLKRAIVEVLSYFQVYRTYINSTDPDEQDRSRIIEAVERAHLKNPGFLYEIKFLGKVLLLELREGMDEKEKRDRLEFVMRFQQFTGPLMAKGFEDTFLYTYNRLLSLNEVGGSPDTFGTDVKSFHAFNSARAEKHPHSMSATSTHDTKRGADVRARINVLSELAPEWARLLKVWARLNHKKKRRHGGKALPGRNDEYLLYQTLIGAWPFDTDKEAGFIPRIKEYMIKAVREAKVHTAWIKPDTVYEDAFAAFIDAILDPETENPFLESFTPFREKVARYGVFNSLSELLLKVTSPGVPDFYQGSELWDLSLVDPDNRRPVDFGRRTETLKEIITKDESGRGALIEELLRTRADGRVKLFLTHIALRARSAHREVFEKGSYRPLYAGGEYANCVVAFLREHGGRRAITVVPRFLAGLIGAEELALGERVWKDTALRLPDGTGGTYVDAITGETLSFKEAMPAGKIFEKFPAALLTST